MGTGPAGETGHGVQWRVAKGSGLEPGPAPILNHLAGDLTVKDRLLTQRFVPEQSVQVGLSI